MADIIERLRRWTHDPKAVPASDLMDEAADEIARLRAMLGIRQEPTTQGATGNCRRPDQR
jgi:uncharacterized membrane protein